MAEHFLAMLLCPQCGGYRTERTKTRACADIAIRCASGERSLPGPGEACTIMLTVHGEQPGRFCDSVSRRNFLQVGSLAVGGLTLPHLLRLKANGAAPASAADKSIIMICLGGGPSHIDTYDMRPRSPVEYRGEFLPISSAVPGMQM